MDGEEGKKKQKNSVGKIHQQQHYPWLHGRYHMQFIHGTMIWPVYGHPSRKQDQRRRRRRSLATQQAKGPKRPPYLSWGRPRHFWRKRGLQDKTPHHTRGWSVGLVVDRGLPVVLLLLWSVVFFVLIPKNSVYIRYSIHDECGRFRVTGVQIYEVYILLYTEYGCMYICNNIIIRSTVYTAVCTFRSSTSYILLDQKHSKIIQS